MGEVVAIIRDKRGATSILDWVRLNDGADTISVAARFSMSVDDARRELRHLERKGLLKGERTAFTGSYGGVTIMWKPTR